jgi:hypothetical protein
VDTVRRELVDRMLILGCRQLRRPCRVVPIRGLLKPGASSSSDRDGEFVEGDYHSPGHWLLGGQLVVSSPHVLDEGMPGAMITLALWSCLSPRIGRSRALIGRGRTRRGC